MDLTLDFNGAGSADPILMRGVVLPPGTTDFLGQPATLAEMGYIEKI